MGSGWIVIKQWTLADEPDIYIYNTEEEARIQWDKLHKYYASEVAKHPSKNNEPQISIYMARITATAHL
jgi:hypothetical protein